MDDIEILNISRLHRELRLKFISNELSEIEIKKFHEIDNKLLGIDISGVVFNKIDSLQSQLDEVTKVKDRYREALKSISNTFISGDSVYSGADSMKEEATEALNGGG